MTPYNFQAGSIAYYFATNLSFSQDISGANPAVNPASPSFMDNAAGFKGINLFNVTHSDNALFFDIRTTKTFTVNAGQHLVVSVMAKDTSDAYNVVPIHYAQVFADTLSSTSAACNASTCNKTTGMTDGGYREVYTVTNSTVRIGIFPKSICNTQAASVGCDLNEPVKFTLRFIVWVSDDANTTQVYSSGGEIFDATAQFHQATSSISCPSSDASFSENYTPGDGEIYLNPTNFILNQATNAPPKESLIAVANLYPDSPVRDSNYLNANDVKTVGSASANPFTIGKFLNKSATADNFYNISFMMRDASGVAVFTDGACTYTGVQTATISSFLTSSKCFISTLAYGSEDHFFVRTLRNFRDQVLLKTSIGKNFTRSYYSFSPKLTANLMQYEMSRPVLQIALLPWVCAVWLILNPLVLLGLMTGLYFTYRMRRVICDLR